MVSHDNYLAEKEKTVQWSNSLPALRQYRIIQQEQFASNFASEKGALLQEYFVYFKKAQRIYDPKFWQSAADAIVRYCLKNSGREGGLIRRIGELLCLQTESMARSVTAAALA